MRRARPLLLALLTLIPACHPAAKEEAQTASPPAIARPAPPPARPDSDPPERATVVTLAPAVPSAAVALDKEVDRLGRGFDGMVGIAVRDLQTGWISHHRGLDWFPQQSVSKLWVAIAALSAADAGRLDLDRPVTLGRDDLTVFHQPIRQPVLDRGAFRTTSADLLTRAMTQSDNTANDRLMRESGGPQAVRAMLADRAMGGIRFGPGERLLQSRIAGLDWRPDYAIGNAFFAAREGVAIADRRTAFAAYLDDPVDGAQPLAIVDALGRLKKGQLLSSGSTDRLLGIMSRSTTGALRLKGGLAPGWTLAHKTGTGQVLDGAQAGYNDVGILTSPEGRSYALAVMIGRTGTPLPARMALMQRVVRATIAYDADLARQQEAGGGAVSPPPAGR